MFSTLKDLIRPNVLPSFFAEISLYFESLLSNKVLVVTNKRKYAKLSLETIGLTDYLTNDYGDHIPFFDLKPTDYQKGRLIDRIRSSPISIILNQNSDLSAHKELLQNVNLNTHFVGNVPRMENYSISFHGCYIDFPEQPIPMKKILAVISTHNDEDIIGQTLDYLVQQDVDILVLENWSTDTTPSIISQKIKRYPKKIFSGKFPERGPSEEHLWPQILDYKVNNKLSKKYEWIIHYDSDEIRMSPWIGKTLGEAISFVDGLGFNAINFTLLDFRPTKEGFSKEDNPLEFFQHFELRDTPGCFLQIKAFKNFGQPIDLSSQLGHEVLFENRKVFPIKFLLKHYPLRSTTSARKKIFKDRRPRYLKSLRDQGAHVQYDKYTPEQKFIWNPEELNIYREDKTAYEKHLVKFLTGVGIKEPSANSE